MTSFRDLGLKEELLTALDELGYEEPSPIQEQAIPELLGGHDMIGQAQTGTGKTAAFGLPLLQYLDPGERRDAGDRPDADPRALHPGHPGPALLRRAPRHQRRRGLRRHLGPRPGRPGSLEGARHRRHRRPDEGPDLARRPDPHRHPLRRPRRGRRDARPRLHRGRRADPPDVPERPPDDALQRDDAAADRAPRRDLHVRPGDDLDHPEEADGGRDRAGLRRGRRRRRRPTA